MRKLPVCISTTLIALLLVMESPYGRLSPTRAMDQGPPMNLPCAEKEWDLLALTNKERAKTGAPMLSTYPSLQEAAETRVKETVTLFEHERPGKKKFYTALDERSVKWKYAAENLAGGFYTPEKALDAFLNSESHRAALLDSHYTHMAVGFLETDSEYQWHWEQLFTGSCKTLSVEPANPEALWSVPVGTSADDWNLVLEVRCEHGTAYAPVVAEMVSGYDKDKPGKQDVMVSYGGKSAYVSVWVTDENTPMALHMQAHVQSDGWQPVTDYEAGTTGESRRLEAIRMAVTDTALSGNLEYRLHLKGSGWEDTWHTAGAMAGTTGLSKRAEAIQIRLTGELADRYDVWYQAHSQTYGWDTWKRNGETAGTTGESKRLEAVRVELRPK